MTMSTPGHIHGPTMTCRTANFYKLSVVSYMLNGFQDDKCLGFLVQGGNRVGRQRMPHSAGSCLLNLYSQLVEMVALMSELVQMQELPDAIVLQV